jgi:hypothetical protein
MSGVLGFMVDVGVGLGGVIGKIGGAMTPVVAEFALGFTAVEPPKAHVLHFLAMMVLLVMPRAAVLSVWMGDWGCGQPI